jgi:hypothetical protein
MTRRELLRVIGGAAIAWPFAVYAQQPAKVARIGYLVTSSLESPEARATLSAFRQGLREHGYVEGQNILIEYRAADGKIERFAGLATETSTSFSPLIRLRLSPPNKRPPPSPSSRRPWATLSETGSWLASRGRAGTSPG